MKAEDLHVPVLLEACLDLLAPALADGGLVIDCTLGMGGHTNGILSRFDNVTVIGIDRDPNAIRLASERLAPFGDRFHAVQTEYDKVGEVAAEFGAPQGILMDLGVSSLQLDQADRGFAYAQDGPLDMRMGESGMTAAELIENATHGELTRILATYGEEKFASRIAARILDHRDESLTTSRLAEIVKDAIPAAARRTGGNPAKRTFQALRIAVNDELGILERTMPAALEALAPGGRLVVESYHSLEDRIVKRAMAVASTSPTPIGLPIPPKPAPFTLVTKVISADNDEIEHNPRSASVKVRAIEKRTT